MPGVMLVKQKVADVAQWDRVFRDPELDAACRAHGLVATATYVDGDDPDTIIVVMDMDSLKRAREFAGSSELAAARERAGAVGGPQRCLVRTHNSRLTMGQAAEGVAPPTGIGATSLGVAWLRAKETAREDQLFQPCSGHTGRH